MALRDYAGNATPSSLVAGISNVALALDIPPADATSWPTGGVNGKFFVTLDRGLPSEERLLATSQSGGSLTIAALGDRGLDGTTAVAHSAGASAEHTYASTEAREANAHINNVALDAHTQYMLASGVRHDLAARHTFAGLGWAPGAPTTIAPDDVSAEGASATPARADHRHGLPAAVPIAIGTSLSEGVSASFARADHLHELGVGSIDLATFFAAGVIDQAAIANGLYVPVGAPLLWMTGVAPTNFVLLQGGTFSRTTFAPLFALWGTTFGAGDGVTTFGVPNFRQRFPIGQASSGTGSAALGSTGGTINHVHNLDTATSYARVNLASGQDNNFWMDRRTVASWNSEIEGNVAGSGGATVANLSGASLGGNSDVADPPYIIVNYIVRGA